MEKEPRHVLYATSARIGGYGLDSVAHETLRGIQNQLGMAIAYANRADDLKSGKIVTLRWHPVRLFSSLEAKYYYGAKKKTLDRVASRLLRKGSFDLFHGWSGEALLSLRTAKDLGIPSVLEIPTWHRHKGNVVPLRTNAEIQMDEAPLPQRWLNRLLVSRQQSLEEYELADLLLVLSEKSEETFLFAGFPKSKLFRMSRGVDVERFRPGSPPPVFRALFVGALIKRKGVHLLLEAWKKLSLPKAELWLAGHPHGELVPYLSGLPDSVKILGFSNRVEELYRQCSLFVFPSECEGSAKATYEAAASGLAQITTRESGDVVVDGENGILIPPNNCEALCEAILRLYRNPDIALQMGESGRKRAVEQFTWDHFRRRVSEAYRAAMAIRQPQLV
ncbi:MAG TPA: glycosyltransferase family 4 protein [Chthoniobacterales bacterium]|jgi:glycosyltransferase involved in cell wall biosynthesis|nr:glycosyltransferase family 4 protein [Chthoniobacterales bacterium]